MNAEFFEKAGRITYRIITGLTKVPVLAVTTLAIAVPLFTFWLSVGLVTFCNVTLMQIMEQPKNVLLLAVLMSMIVTLYRVQAWALRGEKNKFSYANDNSHAGSHQ